MRTADIKLPVDVKLEAGQLLRDRVQVPQRGDVEQAIQQIAEVFGRNHILMPWLKSLGPLEALPYNLAAIITNWGRYRLISNYLGTDPRLWEAIKEKIETYKPKGQPVQAYDYDRRG